MIHLEHIKALAQEANPGPWVPKHAGNMHWGVVSESGWSIVYAHSSFDGYGNGSNRHNAEFIAACDPQTVLQLIDQLEAMQEALKYICRPTMGWDGQTDPEEFALNVATDVNARGALATCIRVAKATLHQIVHQCPEHGTKYVNADGSCQACKTGVTL